MKKIVRKIVIFFLVVYFLFTMSYIVHESIHILQANGKISEVCFLGYGKYYEDGTMHAKYGWVKSYSFPERDLEKEANFIELAFLITFGSIFGIFLGYEMFGIKEEKPES
jgi:Zn-dependent protease